MGTWDTDEVILVSRVWDGVCRALSVAIAVIEVVSIFRAIACSAGVYGILAFAAWGFTYLALALDYGVATQTL